MAETDARLAEGAEAKALARGSLIDHFQQVADMRPVPEDQAKREALARKRR